MARYFWNDCLRAERLAVSPSIGPIGDCSCSARDGYEFVAQSLYHDKSSEMIRAALCFRYYQLRMRIFDQNDR
ncbi:hypothetical protein DFR46_2958, partial [Parasphingopyxis lamellibrachiae]